jgi:hypothetical protein
MANQANPGEQDPSTQAGTRSHQNPGGQPPAKPIEPKHLADEATGRPEPSANPKRAPQHEPGFEEKHQKEAQKETHKRPASERSQTDDSMAKIDADRDVDANKTQKANRTHPARAKQHVKRAKVRKHK